MPEKWNPVARCASTVEVPTVVAVLTDITVEVVSDGLEPSSIVTKATLYIYRHL